MKLSELIARLNDIYDWYDDLDVVCPGDHQHEYKVEFVTVDYIVPGEVRRGYTVIHPDEIDEYENPIKVVSIS